MPLLVVESPAKCQKIRSFLGPDWTVLATMGHLRALDESLDAMGLGTDWKPKYHWLKEKAKAIQQLKDAVQQQPETHVYLAADDDREGEMIAYSVCLLLKLPPATTPRVVFHEITEKAIRHAIQNPRLLDMNRVHAQQARAMLDLMIGFTISPLLWKHVAKSLSAGRCQTPALRLLMEREEAIDAFQASRSWGMKATWRSTTGQQGLLETIMTDELEDEDSVQQILEHARDREGEIMGKEIRPWTEQAPPPLMTSTLQQQASQLFHCSPKQTMSVAQRLYEAGLITYMRTDKAVLSEEAILQARTWVQAEFGEAYLASSASLASPSSVSDQANGAKGQKQKGKETQSNAQEAHEAIRPTHMEQTAISGEWGPMERKIYQLISRRALQSVMAPARGTTCRVTVRLDDLDDLSWVSEVRTTEFEGWRRLGRIASIGEEEQKEEQDQEQKQDQEPLWQMGTRLAWTTMTGFEKETSRPTRYTEASLVQALEKHGIGRPSTFASLLSVIQDKSYALLQDIPATPIDLLTYELLPSQWPPLRRSIRQTRGGEKRKLVPTALGRSVWEWLAVHFEDLFSYGFTASMEKQLDQIAMGEQTEKEVLEQTWNSYQERYRTLMDSASSASSASSVAPDSSANGSAPPTEKQRLFSNGIKAVQTKKGPLLLREGATKEQTQFFGWPKGLSWNKMTEEAVQAYLLELQPAPYMEWKGKPVMKKVGPYGPYLSWEGVSIPFQEETQEQTGVRLDAKAGLASTSSASTSSILKETPGYWIRQGPYGPYILKKEKAQTKAKSIFVSLPKGLDPAVLTDKEVDALYQAGKAAKAAGRNEVSKAAKAAGQNEVGRNEVSRNEVGRNEVSKATKATKAKKTEKKT